MAEFKHPPSIYIVGAQCTGKTTLIKALEEHFGIEDNLKNESGRAILHPNIIIEVARGVLKEHKFNADDIKSSPARALALQDLILKAQVRAEAATSRQDGWFISDRSGADPIVYAKKYVSDVAAHDLLGSPEWSTLKEGLVKSVVIVCEAGAGWLKDDGIRLMPESRDAWIGFHRLFCKCLDEWGVAYEVLPCEIVELQDRIEFVLGIWAAKQRRLGRKA
ncbi:hypothetical protein DL98DRAFT_609406 [Cadophora sp. DSE1049]|nr:hypothetical protein DL98DRAFT_609406 [Cadophora sp. DSE1049]